MKPLEPIPSGQDNGQKTQPHRSAAPNDGDA